MAECATSVSSRGPETARGYGDSAKFPFYLRGVELGIDEDGDMTRSCVVEWIDKDQATRQAPKAEEEIGIRVTDQHRAVYKIALAAPSGEFGGTPPSTLNLPKSIARVVDRKYWGQVYRQNFAADDSPEAVKKALQRGNNFMIGKGIGIIGRDNPWVWITGARIGGEPKRPRSGRA